MGPFFDDGVNLHENRENQVFIKSGNDTSFSLVIGMKAFTDRCIKNTQKVKQNTF